MEAIPLLWKRFLEGAFVALEKMPKRGWRGSMVDIVIFLVLSKVFDNLRNWDG